LGSRFGERGSVRCEQDPCKHAAGRVDLRSVMKPVAADPTPLPPQDAAARTAAALEADYDAHIKRHLPRNFTAHLLHGMLGQTGLRLFNAPTFLPAFILLVAGGSEFTVGLALSLMAFGSTLTPMLAAHAIEHRRRILPVGLVSGMIMRVGVLGVALASFWLEGRTALLAVLACLTLYGLFAGYQMVIFNVLLSKAIPVYARGRLVGIRNSLGGLITAVLAWYGGTVLLGATPTSAGYGGIFLAAFVLTCAGLAALLLVREPEPPTVAVRVPLRHRLRQLPGLLHSDRPYARYVMARALATLGRMGLPFYVLYVGQTTALTGQNLGLLTMAFTASATVANLVWGAIADRHGFRAVFIGVLGLWAIASCALLLSQAWWVVIAVFVAVGSAQEGFRLSAINLSLEFGHRDDVPMRLAVANAASEFAGMLAPLAGGLIVAALGYPAVFIASAVCLAAAAALLIAYVPEPRRAR
jgi:MFS family permease